MYIQACTDSNHSLESGVSNMQEQPLEDCASQVVPGPSSLGRLSGTIFLKTFLARNKKDKNI